MADKDVNMEFVPIWWAVSNTVIFINIFALGWDWLYLFFIPYVLSLGYMARYHTLLSGYLCATTSGLWWLWIALLGLGAYGWAIFFGVMTGVGGLLIIVGVWLNRETVKENVQSGLKIVKSLRKSKNVQELKF